MAVSANPALNGNGAPVYTTSNGRPITTITASQSVGKSGPLLLQDFNLIDLLAHFDRERIPERVVHAKGAGAFGDFVVTKDVTDICSADLFSDVGKRTKVAVRFSTVGGESGSADAARDPRGFSIKFYTEEGNWDMVVSSGLLHEYRERILIPFSRVTIHQYFLFETASSSLHSSTRKSVIHRLTSKMLPCFGTSCQATKNPCIKQCSCSQIAAHHSPSASKIHTLGTHSSLPSKTEPSNTSSSIFSPTKVTRL